MPEQAIPVWNALKNAFEQGRFPQVLLLDGQAGIGKKLLAIDFAKMLCEYSAEPVIWLIPIDGKAEDRDTPAKIDSKVAELSQKFIENPFHTGYITDSAIISVSMAQHLLQNFTLKASGNRVVIITNIDQLNDDAANKLLKTFEEAPQNTYFILTANSRRSLLPTIRSRATCFSVPSMSNSEVSRILSIFGHSANDSILEFAGGSAGKAMLAIESNYQALEGKISEYASAAMNGDASSAILCVQGLGKTADAAALFLEGLALRLLKEKSDQTHYINYIHFLLQAMLAKKFSSEQAIQNMALKLAQKEV